MEREASGVGGGAWGQRLSSAGGAVWRESPGLIRSERSKGLSGISVCFLSEIECLEGESACSRPPKDPPVPKASHLALNH